MIVKNAEIYRKVAQKHNLNPEFVETIGDIVFEELITSLNNPSSLGYELPKLGCWIARSKQIKATHVNTPYKYRPALAPMLKLIEEYRRIKQEKRSKRFEFINERAKQSSQGES